MVALVLGLVALGSGCGLLRGNAAAQPGDLDGSLRWEPANPYVTPVPTSGATTGTPAVVSAPAADAAGVIYRLRPGDTIIISMRVPEGQQPVDATIDERGNIRMPYVSEIRAAGLTTSELEKAIQQAYVDQKIYKYCSVNISVPQRSYFMRGEVRAPGRYPLVGDITLLQAIAAAGGYNEFADPKDVVILRGGKTIPINAKDFERNPEKDISIETGDVIVVNRSIL